MHGVHNNLPVLTESKKTNLLVVSLYDKKNMLYICKIQNTH